MSKEKLLIVFITFIPTKINRKYNYVVGNRLKAVVIFQRAFGFP